MAEGQGEAEVKGGKADKPSERTQVVRTTRPCPELRGSVNAMQPPPLVWI
ncbi:hypothetical protein CGRA01v4_07716 [Colletotrichum graminicola]|nr:hypothetical protein CGRA01v4_07716 [Colletotrichum graminicola]